MLPACSLQIAVHPPTCLSCSFPNSLLKENNNANPQVTLWETVPTWGTVLAQRLGLLVSPWWLCDVLMTSLRGLGGVGAQAWWVACNLAIGLLPLSTCRLGSGLFWMHLGTGAASLAQPRRRGCGGMIPYFHIWETASGWWRELLLLKRGTWLGRGCGPLGTSVLSKQDGLLCRGARAQEGVHVRT